MHRYFKMRTNDFEPHLPSIVCTITSNFFTLTLERQLLIAQYFHEYCSFKIVSIVLKMARAKQIAKEKRARIVILSETGHSQRKIAQILGVLQKGVRTTLERFAETKSFSDRKRSG